MLLQIMCISFSVFVELVLKDVHFVEGPSSQHGYFLVKMILSSSLVCRIKSVEILCEEIVLLMCVSDIFMV